jgi:hypothetical protein
VANLRNILWLAAHSTYKHLTPGNRAAEKESSYSAVFEAVKEKLLWLKCNLEVGSQSYREIASRKI